MSASRLLASVIPLSLGYTFHPDSERDFITNSSRNSWFSSGGDSGNTVQNSEERTSIFDTSSDVLLTKQGEKTPGDLLFPNSFYEAPEVKIKLEQNTVFFLLYLPSEASEGKYNKNIILLRFQLCAQSVAVEN